MDRELQREAAKLYALPAGEYVAARRARARELRLGEPELAAQVAKLPKPTAAAAAVNRLARDEPSEVRALAQAGRALRKAQESAVAGKGAADALAAATAEHRAALERVAREARRLKLSQAVLERVVATLRAASLDPDLQPLLERGVLAHELEAAGFGFDPSLVVAAPTSSRAKPKPTRKANEEKRRRAQEQAEQKARLKAARERLTAAKRALAQAEKAVAEAQAEVDAAQAASATRPSRRRSRSRPDT
jgi:DNA repair exonuclease SbcCD ATPase subunit